MVRQAFGVPAVERVVASTMAVNVASRRVLERLGFSLVRSWVEEWEEPIPGWEQGEVEYVLGRDPAYPSPRAEPP